MTETVVSIRMELPEVSLTEPEFVAQWLAFILEEMEIAERMFEKTHDNWGSGPAMTRSGFFQALKDEPIEWKKVVRRGTIGISIGEQGDFSFSSSKDVTGFLYTESRKYGFVNNGTLVRRVSMTSDFVPKTRPGSLGSGAGKGEANTWGMKPGIEGRLFNLEISERRQPKFNIKASRLAIKQANRFFRDRRMSG